MPAQTPTWSSVQAAWTPEWKRIAKKAVVAYGAAILVEPQKYAPTVTAFLATLDGNAKILQSCKAKLLLLKAAADKETALKADFSKRAKTWNELERDNQQLAAGVLADAVEAPTSPVTGAAPILVVAGIAVTVAGIAWAVAAMQYATAHRERIALFSRELDARVAALNLGQTLPASTIGPIEPQQGKGGGWMLPGLLGLGALAGGGLLLYRFAK